MSQLCFVLLSLSVVDEVLVSTYRWHPPGKEKISNPIISYGKMSWSALVSHPELSFFCLSSTQAVRFLFLHLTYLFSRSKCCIAAFDGDSWRL